MTPGSLLSTKETRQALSEDSRAPSILSLREMPGPYYRQGGEKEEIHLPPTPIYGVYSPHHQ